MVNTRRQRIKDECNEKTRMILSQREKQFVTVRQSRYYGLLILADEVSEMTIFDVVLWRRVNHNGEVLGIDNFFSEVIEIKITRKQTVTPLGEVFSMSS